MTRNSPNLWMPAFIGGGAGGLLSAIPYVDALNCVCCSLVIGSGFLAAFLYSKQFKDSSMTFGAGNGALVGVVAGVFYAVVNGLASWLKARVTGVGFEEAIEEAIAQLESNPQIPAEQLDPIIAFMESGGVLVVGIVFSVAIALIFATIGGLIGGAVFKVEPSAPAPPPIPE